jgi:hypothetical protein
MYVRTEGFEPTWACARYHLKVVRLPFRHVRSELEDSDLLRLIQERFQALPFSTSFKTFGIFLKSACITARSSPR